MPRGRWVPCTPQWVATIGNDCGATVRRPALEPCDDINRVEPVQFMMVGHEHLMVVWGSGITTPFIHETGEPA